ncbi:MAG: precorrin-6y C5,15-methyltransferase (decarboxylating) subunit CbiE [Bacteroidales bacterium]|nr:precorrin-6y C5,15-methyltransferase (decarboxylating) subunit CbiE [Bacteroidales bacterium]
MCKKFKVIGISDSRVQYLHPDVVEIIRQSRQFSGGKRHREIMSDSLPDGAGWIDITVPLDDVFEQYKKHDEITVFASGDPLFYGFATTLQRVFPDADIEVYPSFNSLQMLAHRMNLPYQDMICVSLTGRPWKNLDDALIKGYPLIGVLTDKSKSPDEIAERMMAYGYDNYELAIGECLGNEEAEEVSVYLPEEACALSFRNPNCVILRRFEDRKRYFGIPESEFVHLSGRRNMITKMPVRLLSLAMLDLPQRKTLWDIGFCTGSISIEARLQFPHLDIIAFEKRNESRKLMELNSRKFGAPDIEYAISDFMDLDLTGYQRPDAVFIGGHGGKLTEMVQRLNEVMLPGCVMVFNSVSSESCAIFKESVLSIGKKIMEEHHIALDAHNPITILKAL